MARKKRGDDGGGYSWMDTYGDMVTLLLTFFVMLFALSSVNEDKWEMLVESFSRSPAANTPQIVFMAEDTVETGDQAMPGIEGDQMLKDKGQQMTELPIDLNELYEYIKQYIEANDMDGSVSAEKGPNSVYLRFDNNLFFDGDSATLRPESYEILEFMGKGFKSVEDKILFIRINGHTAAIPNMPDYNVNDWNLSSNRANAVASYFENDSKIDVKKMMTSGYGKNQPLAPNDTEEGRAKNRRVDIMVIGNEFDPNSADDLYTILQQTLGAELVDDKVNASDIITPEGGVTPPGADAPATDAPVTPATDAPAAPAADAPAAPITTPATP